MAVVFAPVNPAAGDVVTLSLDNASAERWTMMSVPPASVMSLGLILDTAGNQTNVFTPDVPGAYEVAATAVRQYAVPAAFPGDPSGELRSMVIAAQTGIVNIGELLELSIQDTQDNGVTLRLVVQDMMVVGAELLNATTAVAYAASEHETVVEALEALVGLEIPDIGEELIERANELRTLYEGHRLNAGSAVNEEYHKIWDGAGYAVVPDTVNVIAAPRAESVTSALALLADLSLKLRRHMVPEHTLALRWHDADDTENVLHTTAGTLVAGATLHLADALEIYRRHIATWGPQYVWPVGAPPVRSGPSDVHYAQDTANVPAEATPLTDLIVALLGHFADSLQWPPEGTMPGAVQGRSMFGFR